MLKILEIDVENNKKHMLTAVLIFALLSSIIMLTTISVFLFSKATKDMETHYDFDNWFAVPYFSKEKIEERLSSFNNATLYSYVVINCNFSVSFEGAADEAPMFFSFFNISDENKLWEDNGCMSKEAFVLYGSFPESKDQILLTKGHADSLLSMCGGIYSSYEELIGRVIEFKSDGADLPSFSMTICGVESTPAGIFSIYPDFVIGLDNHLSDETAGNKAEYTVLFPSSLDEAGQILQTIEKYNLRGITYRGQYYRYAFLHKISEFGGVVLSLFVIPLLLVIVFSLVCFVMKYYARTTSRLKMLRFLGMSERATLGFVSAEVLTWSGISFLLSAFLTTPAVALFVNWLKTNGYISSSDGLVLYSIVGVFLLNVAQFIAVNSIVVLKVKHAPWEARISSENVRI